MEKGKDLFYYSKIEKINPSLFVVDSTLFLSHVDQLGEIQQAKAQMNKSGTDKATIVMNRMIGKGYRKGGGDLESTASVTVIQRHKQNCYCVPLVVSKCIYLRSPLLMYYCLEAMTDDEVADFEINNMERRGGYILSSRKSLMGLAS